MAKEKLRRDDPTGAHSKAFNLMVEYQDIEAFATRKDAVRRKIRNILCLLGGSRQDFAFQALKAAVFAGDCPAAPIIRRMNLPNGTQKPRLQMAECKNRSGPWPIGRAALKTAGIPRTVDCRSWCQRADHPTAMICG